MSEAASADTPTASDPIQNAEESQKGLTMKTTEQKYQFTFGDQNPDTQLLAAMLRAEYEAVLASDLMQRLVAEGLDEESVATLVWYRIAERAKELRA